MQATIRIKGYDRIEQIAVGRRAVLFRARDRECDRPVVFKLLLPHLVEDPRFLRRFKHDVRLAGAISHENLVNVLQYGRAEDSYFIAMEQYRGTSLDKLLVGCRRVSVDVALQVIVAVARALDACHSGRLIHRDVSPSNIVFTSAGGVKLDNLVLATDVAGNCRVDFAGRISRTLAYMSPEQTQGENLAGQSDIFSLGLVAWELLCGKSAFGQGTAEEVADRVQTTVLPRVSDVNPMVEPVFGEIVGRMLEKDRSRRYTNVSDVLSDLVGAIRTHGYVEDTKSVARFAENPKAYMEWYTREAIEKLNSRPPVGRGADPIALMRHYEKLEYLEPSNEDVRSKLEHLKRLAAQAEKTGTSHKLAYADPTTTYRVILEALAPSSESRASFAVKLATKLRVPLAAVRSYVENMPLALPGEHPHRKALFLAGVMEELGAVARVEVCRDRRKELRVCPECQSPVEPDAEFCSFCQHRFVAYVELRPGLDDEGEDPLQEDTRIVGPTTVVARFLGLSMQTRVLLGLLVLLATVLMIAMSR